MREAAEAERFERMILPHLDAAYNLARWLTRNNHDAEDVVQEACMRAQKFFGGFHGDDGRAWLIKIVRNTCYTWLERNRPRTAEIDFDEDKHSEANPGAGPLSEAQRREEQSLIHRALERLNPEYREAIVLRDLDGFSYKEIADIAGVPLGTVMSRIARAREQLEKALAGHKSEETNREM